MNLLVSFKGNPPKKLLREIRKCGGRVTNFPETIVAVPEPPTDIVKMTADTEKNLHLPMDSLYDLLSEKESNRLMDNNFLRTDPIAKLVINKTGDMMKMKQIGRKILSKIRFALRELGLDFSDYLDQKVLELAEKVVAQPKK